MRRVILYINVIVQNAGKTELLKLNATFLSIREPAPILLTEGLRLLRDPAVSKWTLMLQEQAYVNPLRFLTTAYMTTA